MTEVEPKRSDAARSADGAAPSKRGAADLRERAAAEGRQFLVLFLYLWVLFGLFVLNERIVLHQHGMDFAAHGFAILNAFILAKVMLVAEHLDVSRWLPRRPLIYPILHDSFAFAVLFITFHFVEEAIMSRVRGEAFLAARPSIGGGGLSGIVCVAVILFFALIPFFAFRHVGRALGPARLNALLFLKPDRLSSTPG